MEFFNSAIEVLQTLVVALGAGLGVWGAINLLEGYGNDNPAFLFDTFSNPSAQQIDERLEGFVRRIRESHPTTPLIFLQTEVRESGNFDLKKRAFEDAKREAARKGMEKILETDKNIWFINPGMELGDDHEATVDGVHPTDLGFERMLKKVQPQIIRILQKHGIK